MLSKIGSLLLAVVLLRPLISGAAQDSIFTYQGRLNEGTFPANGLYDFSFSLYPSNSAGQRLAGVVTRLGASVTSGIFTVPIDFGTNVFAGPAPWMEIAVRKSGASVFSTLAPRQQLTAAPFSLYAASAGSVANGQVIKSINGLKDDVTLAAGQNVSLVTNGNILTLSAISSATPATSESNYPRFAYQQDNPSGGANVVVNAVGPGTLNELKWRVAEVNLFAQPNRPSTPFVRITVDDDSPQTLYLKNSADADYYPYPITTIDKDTLTEKTLGAYSEWEGELAYPLKFKSTLKVETVDLDTSTKAPLSSDLLINVPVKTGYFRAIYILIR